MKRVRINHPVSTQKRPAGTLALLSLAALVALACTGWLGLASADAAAQKARKTLPGQKTSAAEQTSKPTAKREVWRRDARSRSKRAGESAQKPNALAACVTTGINLGQTINGQLTADDCPFGDGTVFDRYTFNGTAGHQISITLTSNQFDAYLFLVADDGVSVINENDDSSGTNSRIPAGSGLITLPYTGEYQIIANAFDPNDTFGSYTLTLASAGPCTPSGAITAGVPVNGSLATTDCKLADETLYDAYTFSGTAGQQISITLSSSAFDAYLYLLDDDFTVLGEDDDDGGGTNSRIPAGGGFITLPFTGTYLIVANTLPSTTPGAPSPTGAYTLTVNAAGGECPATPITVGQTLNGTLTAGECMLPDETLYDLYTFTGTTGQEVAISMNSSAFDAFLYLAGPDRTVIAQNDDGGGGTNSRIPATTGFFTLPANGTYYILANTLPSGGGGPSPTGAYTISLTGPAPAVTEVQFSAATYAATEDAPNTLTVTVNRTGNTTGASVVNYATSNGTANDRSDFTAAYGRLRFAAGETSKTFLVFITDDAFDEADETFTLTLSSPTGATLGAQSTATVTIDSNDIGNGPSPVKTASFNAEFFVRQHYRDFLNRNADAGGLAFWVNQLSNCSDPPPADLLVCRINVSAAFFLSIEFRDTGYLAYRTHKTAFGDLPGKPVPIVLRDFLADTRQIGEGVIVGTPGWPDTLEANKDAYMLEFVNRPEFLARHPLTLTPAQFVDALNANAGGALSQAERDQQVANLTANNTAQGRADVLRAVAEDEQLQQSEFNKAFVFMQYVGYLRRDPDATPDTGFGGFNFWLGKLNEFNGNFIDAEMVKAFITSLEYEQRFGQ